MGCSVSYATGSTAIAYRSLESENYESGNDIELDAETRREYESDRMQDDFNFLVDWIRETAKSAWPSMQDCDEWLGREDHAILSNDLAYIGVSEYCGLVSIWLVDRADRYDGYGDSIHTLCAPWCSQITPRFYELFGEYRKIGTASNGESFYEKA